MFRTERQISAIICTHTEIAYTLHCIHAVLEKAQGKGDRSRDFHSFFFLVWKQFILRYSLLCVQQQVYGRACAIISA